MQQSPELASSVGSVPLYCDSAACRERCVAARWMASSCSSGAKMRPAYLCSIMQSMVTCQECRLWNCARSGQATRIVSEGERSPILVC